MKKIVFISLSALFIASNLLAAPAKSTPKPAPEPSAQEETRDSLYNKGKTESDKGDFKAALMIFEKANRKYVNDPEILNMLAYAQRKTGEVDKAIENYKKALRLKPDFPEAREYLGEAYIQAALAEISTLKSYGPEADHELEDLVESFKEAAANL